MKNVTKLLASLFVALSLLGGVDLLGQTCPDGMISYWKMQEMTGPTYEDFHGTNDAFAPVSMPSAMAGISGRAQLFSEPSSTYVTIPDNNEFDWGGGDSFSIELWVKFASTTGENQVFIGRDESINQMRWWIGANVTGKITWFIQASDGSNGSITTDESFNNGSWHHVVAVRDGTMSRNYLYVDGALQNLGGTSVSLAGNLSSNFPITIGAFAYNTTPDYFLTGAIDEVAIYNRVLDPITEVTSHYNNLRLYQIGYCDGDDPIILSEPITTAMVGELYSYDVDASGNSVPTYSLIEGPTGMSINGTTGVINWTPSSITQNGHVTVEVSNDKGTVEQEFNIYIADIPNCRNNLVSYWDFNDGYSAPYFDNMNNYILSGTGPVPVPGISGNGLLFDGSGDSLNMHDTFGSDKIFFDFDNMPNFSIELWVKSDASPTNTMVLVGRDDKTWSSQYWVGINTDGSVGFRLRDWPLDPDFKTTYLEGGSVLDGSWHHIVASYSNTANRVQLYVDNDLVDNATESFWNFGGNASLNVGMMDATGATKYWFDGVLDELAFYSVQLTEAAVAANYSAGMSGLGACTYNHSPVIVSTPITTVNQNEAYDYQFEASEIDAGDVLTIEAISKPDWMTFSFVPGNSTAQLSGTPGNEDVGTTGINIRVTDGSVSVNQTFNLEVVNVNDIPVITSSPLLTIDQNSAYSYTVEAVDPDGDDLVYSAPVKPASFQFDPATQILSGTPTNDDVGVVDITVRVSDGTEDVDQVFQITVNNVNDAPVISSTPATEIFQGEEYKYTVIATDPDGDDLTYSAPILPGWLVFDGNTHRLSGITEDFVGLVDVTIEVTDGSEKTSQVFQIEVKNVNDLPVITSDPVTSVRVGESYLYQITATDEDPGDELTFIAESIPAWLSLTAASSSAILSGTPGVGDKGTSAVIIKVSDGTGEVIQAFSVTVDGGVGVEKSDGMVSRVYPIPATDKVYFELIERGNVLLSIYDATGAILKSFKFEDTDEVMVDITDLADNLLFYKLTLNNNSTVGKIIKK